MRGPLISLVFLSLTFSVSGWAARKAIVETEAAEVHEGPNGKSTVIDRLQKGEQVDASNLATEGFFKVRTKNGIVGWVPADALKVEPQAQSTMLFTPGKKKETVLEYKGPPHRWTLNPLVTINFYQPKALNDLIGFETPMKTGPAFGAELSYALQEAYRVVLRVEWLMKNVTGRETRDSKVYNFDLTSMPFMVGGKVRAFQIQSLTMYVGAFVGLGLFTKFNAVSLNDTAPNQTEYNASAFTGLLKADLTYQVTPSIGMVLEAGYRYLKTGDLTAPATQGNGNGVFQDTSGAYLPFAIDLSGPLLGAGLSFTF